MSVSATQNGNQASAFFNATQNQKSWPVAPQGYGYDCNQNLTFTSEDGSSQLVISRFAAQPFNVNGTDIISAPNAGKL